MRPIALAVLRLMMSSYFVGGSTTCTNTIGMVRVASRTGATVILPPANMTSGPSATNSAAYLRR